MGCCNMVLFCLVLICGVVRASDGLVRWFSVCCWLVLCGLVGLVGGFVWVGGW